MTVRGVVAIVVLFQFSVCLNAQPQFPLWESHRQGDRETGVFAGELMLAELQCIRCHEAPEAFELSSSTRDVVGLKVSSLRWRSEYLLHYLADVAAVDPRSRMPDMLSGLNPSQRLGIAEALRAYLRSGVNTPQTLEEIRGVEGSRERGRHLFESSGCLACHQNVSGRGPSQQELTQRLSWGDLNAKYRPGGLVDFLLDGTHGHGAGSAPSLPLTLEEANDVAAFLVGDQHSESTAENSDTAELVVAGREGFVAYGCVRCHALPDDQEQATLSPNSIPNLMGIRADRVGCLNPFASSERPRFRLTDDQRQAIQVAIEGIQENQPPTSRRLLARDMAQFGCVACHHRDGHGGLSNEVDSFFVAETDLGDEGRLPPSLTGVGRKLKQAALIKIIEGDLRSRPSMSARMPGFDGAVARRMATRFAALDIPEDEEPTVREVAENQVGRNMWGRALLGTEGLACISCHALGGHPSLGIQAIDLALAPQRLRPEWFRDYLIDPASFRPGTRMPAFWPSGKPSMSGFGGSTTRQIDSIWAYLNELDQSRLPVGLVNERELLLEPKGRPIVFRTFMKDVGNHAIAVGFEAGIHAAFDARDLRWVIGWKGAFLDAESTWHDRFTPPAEPEGHDVISIQSLVSEDDRQRSFDGYHLDRDSGVPTFSYRYGTAAVLDTMAPFTESTTDLRRVISLDSSEDEIVWIEIASGSSVTPVGNGWQVDERLYVECHGTLERPRLLQAKRLEAPLKKRNGLAKIEVIYRW